MPEAKAAPPTKATESLRPTASAHDLITNADSNARPANWKVAFAFAAIFIIWGSTYLAISFAVATVPPFLMTGFRFVLSGFSMYVIARTTSRERTTWRHWFNATWIGCLMFLSANALVSWAETMVPSGIAALIIATVPLWMVALDTIFFGATRPNIFAWVGFALGLAGVATLVDPFTTEGASLDPRGVWALLAACFSWSIGSLLGRSAAQPKSLLLAVSMQMLAGGVCLLIFATLIGEWSGFDPRQVSSKSLWSIAYLIVFGGMVAFSCYSWLMRVCKASSVATYAYVNPVIAVFLGSWLGGESLTSMMLFGAALIILAVVLIVSLGRPAKSV